MQINATLIGQAIAFLVLIWFTWKFVWPPLLGAIEGVVIGLALGFAVVRALKSQGIRVFDFSPSRLIVIFVVAIVLGMVAAILPARRATKVNILESISTM